MSEVDKKSAARRAEELRKVINYHRTLYHVYDRQEISEAALDSLKYELKNIEEKYPDLIVPDSPTQRVGGAPLPGFKKVRHAVSQWSFDDAFSPADIEAFHQRVVKFLGGQSPTYICELKIDGFKIILTYKRGRLITAATRGNGAVGEEVTSNVRTIDSIPLVLEREIDLVVEGEIWLSKKELARINNERGRKGEVPLANPRNAAAGSIRQLDPKISASRRLDSFIYDLGQSSADLPQTQFEELKMLQTLGFKVNRHFKLCANIEEVISYWREWQKKAGHEEYGLDGVVVKVNERSFQERLGYTGKAPRFGIAFKFPAEQVTTIVEDIVLQVGRTGVITPVARLRPVSLAGSTISRATLHNEDEIRRLDVRVGDTVILQKAGDVIPDIVSVVKELRPTKAKPYKFPESLEACGGPIERIPGQAAYRCSKINSFAVVRRRFYHFVGRHCFDIRGLGPRQLDALLEAGLITDFADIFDLAEEDLLSVPRMAEVSSKKLVTAIKNHRRVTLARLIASLSIDQVGKETAEDLAAHFKTIERLAGATREEFENVSGVGPIVAASLFHWFNQKENKKLLARLLERVIVEKTVRGKAGDKLAGKIFVLTGAMETLGREEARTKIRSLGGQVVDSVSVKTDYVVVGKNPGSKYKRAVTLGRPILTEAQFKRLVG